jgi:serine/threonine protein kinase/Tol biopolymer transport system component
MIGQTISHYKILEKLGEGGMGVVYKAHDTKLDRDVALKFLPHQLTANEAEQARFVQEARAASALNHPNICGIHSIGEEGDKQFIDMEYVDGVTLREKTAGGRLQIADCVGYAIQIGEALQEAHSKGIVHRDVKADNIMVNSRNHIKVTDFGLAKLKGSLKLTRTTSTVGTLAYMAPEQIQGGEVDARSDLFSFGVVFYEMLTGHLPFRGEHEAAMVYSIVNESAVPIEKYLPDVSSELVHVINRALEKDPEDRYQSVHDMVIDLRRLKKETSRVARLVSASEPSEGSAGIDQGSPRTLRFWTKKRITILSSAVLLVCTAAIVWMAIPAFLRDNSLRYESLEIKKLTNSGDILVAALSPDGQYVAYSTRVAKGANLYLEHIPSASTTKLWQADEGDYDANSGLTFSPDGNYLYFLYKQNLYRLVRLGGEPRIVVRGKLSGFAISPEGNRLATDGSRELMTMNEDGSNEKRIGPYTTGKYRFRRIPPGRPWSPDGKLIALKWYSQDFSREGLVIHNVIDSTEIDILNPLWSRIDNVVWATDGKNLLLAGKRTEVERSQIQSVSYPQGEVRQITSDANGFSNLSASADGKSLLAIQSISANSLWVLPSGDEIKIQKVLTGEQEVQGWVSWTTDNRILFVTRTLREHSLKAVFPDGSKLTILYSDTIVFDLRLNAGFGSSKDRGRTVVLSPQMSRDTRTFYFESEVGYDVSSIWKVDLQNGSHQNIYNKAYSPSMALSTDEQWLYITKDWGLLKVKNDGSQVDTMFAKAGELVYGLRLSPDGLRLACSCYNQKLDQFETVIVDVKSGKMVQTLPITSSVEWTPEGRGLCYVITTNNVPNIWMQSLAGGQPKQITHFASDS